jgi:hypothetical protein
MTSRALGCVALIVLALTACSDDDAGESVAETTAVDTGAPLSCIFSIRYEGAVYEAWGVQVAPRPGPSLGTGMLPECDDEGLGENREEIEVLEMPGVSPEVAFLSPGYDDSVFVRRGISSLPEVEALQRPVRCDPADEPIDLAGPWLGVLGDVGERDGDILLPYDVELFAASSSVPRYERAYLTVRVPETIEKPLTRQDVVSSLWEGGTVSATVRCGDGGAYVAERIASQPPG